MSPAAPDRAVVDRIVAFALDEDLATAGDVTSAAVVDADRRATARIVAREALVVAGLPVAAAVFDKLDSGLAWNTHTSDGTSVEAGCVVAEVAGSARAILAGERTALNFLMRMSGIASVTRAAVDEVRSTGTRVLDTRKTAPGLRVLDKYAVAAGGGDNHRMGLFDAVMIKDTHVGVQGSVGDAVRHALAAGHAPERITAEVRSGDELRDAISAGAGRALLDNMNLEQLSSCVAIGRGRIVLEASGGLRPGNLRSVAETGVDCLSLGWLTHSARSADLAMEIDTGADTP